MSELLIPRSDPPQVTDKAKTKIVDMIFAEGLTKLWQETLPVFKEKYPPLTDYVRGFAFEQNGAVLEDTRPARAFRTAAVITAFAYYESGYDHTIGDDAFTVASLDAQFEGIPQAYLLSFMTDPVLQKLTAFILDAPEMQDGIEHGSYEEIVAIGAGCTRHYMQYALAS